MRIRITGKSLPKAQFAGQKGDPDDAWIRKILKYESKQGLGDGSGHPTFGFNNANPRNLDEAVALFKQQYLPKVSMYPMGMRERMADYIFNTGRNPNDLLLYNAGKISLDQLNSPNSFPNEWNQYGKDIEKMYSDPDFINNLDTSKLNVYRTTKQTDGNPNIAYANTWKPRTTMWGTYKAPGTSALNTAVNSAVSGVKQLIPKVKPAINNTVTDIKNFIPQIGPAVGNAINGVKQFAATNFNAPAQTPTQSASTQPVQANTQSNVQSNVPTTLMYNGSLISPNDPNYNQILNQSSVFLNSGRQKFGAPSYDKVGAAKSSGPKFPKLSFKPFAQAPVQPTAQSNNTTASTTNAATQILPAAASAFPFIPNQGFSNSVFSLDKSGLPPLPKVTVVNADGTTTTTGDFGDPIRLYSTDPNSGGGAANPLLQTASPNLGSWYSKNIGQPVDKAFQDLDRLTSWGNFGTELVNSYKRKQDFDKRLRRQTSTDSLFPEVPSEMSGNRGDYVVSGSRFGEFRPDEYVVNKGMYTGQFLPRMAQYGGGVIPEALTMPIDPIELSAPIPYATSAPADSNAGSPAPAPRSSSSGANPVAEQTWQEVSTQFPGVKHLGIWGDEAHKKTKSDHNTGDALDIGIKNADQGSEIAKKLIKEAQDKNIKYIIWNKQIWNPSISNSWRPYDGKNPHTDHVHVSFNRSSQPSGGEIALTHNNPLNIHHGDFTSKYGGKQGARDSGGYVSMFPDFETGIRAAKDLLFGPNYSNLTISQARNKWVSGSPDKSNASTPDIVKTMGKDKVLADLTPAERDKLIKQFARWEGKQAYQKLSGMQLYADGGSISYREGDVYELTEDEIKSILSSGGDIEFL